MARRLLALIIAAALAGVVAASATAGFRSPRQPRPVVVQTMRSGFDWADAAIGAAAALGLASAVVGVLFRKGGRRAP
jgi:hypothetical protein